MTDLLPITATPVHLVPASDTAQLSHSAGDGPLYLAETREELIGEGFNPLNTDTLPVGESLTVSGPIWIRTESPRHRSTAILIPPDPQ